MLLLLQVRRETLQATKYVELLLVADYAEVRKGIMFILTEHQVQSIPPAASPAAGRTAGAQHVSSCHPNGPTPTSRQGELCLGHFCPSRHDSCAATISHCWPGKRCRLRFGCRTRVEGQFWPPKVPVVGPGYRWERLPSA